MVYLPILLGALTAFCWGTSDYLSRRSSQKVGPYRTTVYMHVMSIVTLVLLLPLLRPTFTTAPTPVLVLVVVSAVNFSGFIFLYRGFHRGIVSVVAPIAYSYPAITTVLAMILLGAVLTETKLLALAGIILGVILVSTRFSELRSYVRGKGLLKLSPGVGSAALSAASFGAAFVGLGYVTPLVGYVLPVLYLRGLGGLFGFLFAPALKQSVRPNRHSITPVIGVMGTLETAGLLSFNVGVSFGSSSLPIVAALSGMGGAFATVYATTFLRERPELNQIGGILLTLLGVFFLLYLTS